MSDDSNPAKVITEPLKNIGAQDILSVGAILYDGTLRKRSRIDRFLGSTKWKQRFVVISQGCIYCFKDEYATKPLTAFALCYFQGAADVDIAGVLNSFEVRHEEAGKNPYQFAAETEEKRKNHVDSAAYSRIGRYALACGVKPGRSRNRGQTKGSGRAVMYFNYQPNS